jgi:small subunit ribosomal protein S16
MFRKEMAVKIRLARVGKKNAPLYRIVAIDGHSKRDGKTLEILGTYNPIRKQIVQFHADRVKFWQERGAITSGAVLKIERLHSLAQRVVAS